MDGAGSRNEFPGVFEELFETRVEFAVGVGPDDAFAFLVRDAYGHKRGINVHGGHVVREIQFVYSVFTS